MYEKQHDRISLEQEAKYAHLGQLDKVEIGGRCGASYSTVDGVLRRQRNISTDLSIKVLVEADKYIEETNATTP